MIRISYDATPELYTIYLQDHGGLAGITLTAEAYNELGQRMEERRQQYRCGSCGRSR